ncbi:MAG TPA: 7TM-DISM domain-containing protein, partial [Anaerolineales bacterium]|nr:7TM-DISM domain-containing protein [Anaerolineales bacterium]
MNRRALWIACLLILISVSLARAQSANGTGTGPVILSDDAEKYLLGLHLEILEDPGGQLTIQEVTSPEYSNRFVPSQEEVPNYGFTGSAYWVRFRLRNESQSVDDWLLEVGFPNMHYVDLYLPDGVAYVSRQTGVLR